MTNRKFVLNADDFGMSSAFNTAVSEGYQAGILKSTSLVANGNSFEEAVNKVIPSCPDLGVGVHLNIIEGKALLSEQRELTDANGNFNNSYGLLILKSLNKKNTDFIQQLENEFRAQIEKIKNAGVNITHIDSHVHTHAIPAIFNLTAKLAKEYGIKQIRTQYEHLYMIPEIYVHLKSAYYVNLIKVALLNFFTYINKPVVKKYGLSTNDYLLGVGYTSMMNNMTISCGINALGKRNNVTIEALIHPCRYEDGTIDNHFTEYRITQSQNLKEYIENLGYEITNYQ